MIRSCTSQEAKPDSWLVIWTESRAEKKVEARIAALGVAPWLPTMNERHRWSDSWREVVCSIFPGYRFARTGLVEWHKVLRTPRVLTIVKREGRPALLANGFVATLRAAIESIWALAVPVAERVDYRPRDEVIVQRGPLKGVRGIMRERRGEAPRDLGLRIRGAPFTMEPTLVSRGFNSAGLFLHTVAVSMIHLAPAGNSGISETIQARLCFGTDLGRWIRATLSGTTLLEQAFV